MVSRTTDQGPSRVPAEHWQDLVLTRPKTASLPRCMPDRFGS